MKYFLFWLAIVLAYATISCTKQDDFSQVASCNSTGLDSSATHPKAVLFQGILDKFSKEKGLPGIAALVYTPQNGVWMGASGYSQVEGNVAMQPCNLFMSASVAKMYHAVLTLKMQEKGLLSINDKIDQYLPSDVCDRLPNGHTATIKQLLNHSSGIPNPTGSIGFLTNYINDFKKAIDPKTYVGYIYGAKPLGEPGQVFNYSDGNYILLAMVLDKIYGDHAQAMSDFVIKPLGLSHTFYRNELGYKNRSNLVNSYADFYNEKILRNVSAEERVFNESNIGHDGFKFTVHDGFLFLKKLFIEKTILGQQSLDQMLNNDAKLVSFTPNERALLGAFLLKDDPNTLSISHEGQTIGSADYFGFYPMHNGIIIVCSNFGGAVSPLLYDAMFNRGGKEDCLLQSMEKAIF